MHGEQVAIQDADVAHAVAAHAEQVVRPRPEGVGRHLELRLDVFGGEDRLARRDPADHGQVRVFHAPSAVVHRAQGAEAGTGARAGAIAGRGCALGVLGRHRPAAREPQAARRALADLDHTLAGEGAQVFLGRVRGPEAEAARDVGPGGGIARLGDVGADEREHLALAGGEFVHRAMSIRTVLGFYPASGPREQPAHGHQGLAWPCVRARRRGMGIESAPPPLLRTNRLAHLAPAGSPCAHLAATHALQARGRVVRAARRVARAARHVTWWPALLLLLLLSLAQGQAVAAADAAARGREIAADAVRRAAGFVDYQVDVRMLLVHPNAGRDERQMRVRHLELPGGGERSLVLFDAPADQRGTALLTHSRAGAEDEQWLYLPALGRVKRIAGGHRSGPFVGSEFAFEDLTEQQLGRYTYRWLDVQRQDGAPCDRVERIPVDPDSGYARQVAWYDQDERRLRRIDFFDRRGGALKTYVASDFRRHEGRWWRPARMVMLNQLNGRRTELLWGNFRFATGLDAERDFSVTALRRSR